MMGCRVLVAEPLSENLEFMKYSLNMNGVSHLVDIRQVGVGKEKGQAILSCFLLKVYLGTATIYRDCVDMGSSAITESEYPGGTKISIEPLDELITEDVLLLKIDVEVLIHPSFFAQCQQGL